MKCLYETSFLIEFLFFIILVQDLKCTKLLFRKYCKLPSVRENDRYKIIVAVSSAIHFGQLPEQNCVDS